MSHSWNIPRWLVPALLALSWAYGLVVRARNTYYERVPGATQRAPLPVISVGNITVGGTGKTPLVIEIVQRLRALGRRPAVLTRGYKAAAGGAADEVLEFRDALPAVPVVVDPDRVAGAAAALREHAADCVVLDDGFQHRRLARDLDIVLIDALDPWGGGRVLPAGRLREPLAGLRRADLVVITRANQVAPGAIEAIRAGLEKLGCTDPVVAARVVTVAAVDLAGQRIPLERLAGRTVVGVCGLGNPRTFAELVRSVATLVRLLVRPDHHRYGAADVARIAEQVCEHGAEMVVTTRKDWVKLAPLWPTDGVPLVRLDVRVEPADGAAALDVALRQALETHHD